MSAPVLLLDAAWRIDRVIDTEHACELLVMNRVVAASAEMAIDTSTEPFQPTPLTDAGEVAGVRTTWSEPTFLISSDAG